MRGDDRGCRPSRLCGAFCPDAAVSHKVNPEPREALAVTVPLLLFALTLPARVESAPAFFAAECVQVHPPRGADAAWARSPDHSRAVLLIHGLRPHTFSNSNV